MLHRILKWKKKKPLQLGPCLDPTIPSIHPACTTGGCVAWVHIWHAVKSSVRMHLQNFAGHLGKYHRAHTCTEETKTQPPQGESDGAGWREGRAILLMSAVTWLISQPERWWHWHRNNILLLFPPRKRKTVARERQIKQWGVLVMSPFNAMFEEVNPLQTGRTQSWPILAPTHRAEAPCPGTQWIAHS